MDLILGIIIGVIVLVILVVLHELGHALVAKRYGVIVEEFGVGFPPKAWGKRISDSILGKNVLFSLNWLPLGGFVKLQGEHDAARKKGDYGAATFWQKTQILLAGVAMNWLTAALLLSILAAIGMPRILTNQFTVPGDTVSVNQPVELVGVSQNMPAAQAGLQQGDKILRVNGAPLTSAKDLSAIAAENKGKSLRIIYSRGNVEHETTVALRANNDDQKGYMGASPAQQELIRASWSAPIVGICTTAQLSWETLQGLGGMVVDGVSGLSMKLVGNSQQKADADKKLASVGDSVAGPVGIFGVIFPAAEKAGPTYVLMLAAIISLTLAVMNILPIPALDGGRWFVTAVFKILKKPLTKEIEEKIHGAGFMILMGLVVLITIADIGKLR
ncbi:MAG TPA: M50 family metallopeptidase [Candidatus Saccharimonas sp.]|nr:site-2 protease family protein [Candidatus Saccharibacteria bacterium]HPQ82518.1 M50 family metallopeptidase [Candidatus Saccharimonas sp.]